MIVIIILITKYGIITITNGFVKVANPNAHIIDWLLSHCYVLIIPLLINIINRILDPMFLREITISYFKFRNWILCKGSKLTKQ